MSESKIFNFSREEYERIRKIRINNYDCNEPINKDVPALEACLRGSKKLLAENKSLLREIYRKI